MSEKEERQWQEISGILEELYNIADDNLQKVERLEADKTTLQKQLEEVKSKRDKFEEELNKKKNEIAELQAKLEEEQQSHLNKLGEAKGEIRVVLGHLNELVETNKKKETKLDEELKKLKNERKTFDDDKKTLDEDKERIKRDNYKIEAYDKAADSEFDASGELRTLRDAKDTLERENNKLKDTNKSLEDDLKYYKDKVDELREKLINASSAPSEPRMPQARG